MRDVVLPWRQGPRKLRRVCQWLGRSEVTLTVVHPAARITLHFKCFKGYRLASVTPLTGRHAGVRTTYPFFEEYLVKKRVVTQAVVGGAKSLADASTKLLRSFPSIVQHLVALLYEDGEKREPGWLTIRSQGSAWVATAKDPDAAASIAVTAPTIDDALMALEMALSNPETPWEPDQWLAKRKKRR